METIKHFVSLDIPRPFAVLFEQEQRFAALRAGRHLRNPLPPHITFHRPIRNISTERMLDLTRSAVLQIQETRIVTADCYTLFERPASNWHVVMLMVATLASAKLWVALNNLLMQLPEYGHDAFDDDNTLHTSIITDLTDNERDLLWPELASMRRKQHEIPLRTLTLYSKKHREGWKPVEVFPVPKK